MKGLGANRQFRNRKTTLSVLHAMLASAMGQFDPQQLSRKRQSFRGTRMNTSRHMPHQGHKEMARRVRQKAKGMIT